VRRTDPTPSSLSRWHLDPVLLPARPGGRRRRHCPVAPPASRWSTPWQRPTPR